jgi:hypothetical protein
MVIPNEGKEKLITMCFATPTGTTEDFNVDLYQNNYTPVDGSSLSNFTLATFTGYATVAVARSTFGSASIVSNVAEITSSVSPLFTCSGGSSQTVYGWVMSGQTSGKVYAAQLLFTPRTMTPGSSEELTPFTLSLQSIP